MIDIQNRQTAAWQLIQTSYQRNQLHHAYAFLGHAKEDQQQLCQYVAKLLLCENAHCNNCDTCHRIEGDIHPNVITVTSTGKLIKKEQIQHLKEEATKTALENKPKIYLIEDAHLASISATNSLLKFLEEPTPNTYILLTAPSKNLLLPTIVSRVINLHLKTTPAPLKPSQPLIDVTEAILLAPADALLIVVKNDALLKEEVTAFLQLYSLFFQCLTARNLGQPWSQPLPFSDTLYAQVAHFYPLDVCLRQLKKIEDAKGQLINNMNVMMCFDLLFLTD